MTKTPSQKRNHRRAASTIRPLRAENALLRATLEEARRVLAMCGTRRFDAPEDEEVGRLGARLGYGAVMSAASREWARLFDGTPQEGSQHTSGPAERTVSRTIAAIDKVLGFAPTPTGSEAP